MMDQDVVQTDATRHTRPDVMGDVMRLHIEKKKPIVGYGVGYPTRQAVPGPFDPTDKPLDADRNSPAQQSVSITAPFRRKLISGQVGDGIYPAYMVAGGEDMLAGFQLDMIKDDGNVALRGARIVKTELTGPADTDNRYWKEERVETLRELYEKEKRTKLK